MFSPIANTFLEFQKKYSENNNYIDTYLASNNGNYAEKKFDKAISSVELLELLSKTKPTTQGGNGEWGYNKSKLWVNKGIRANFRVIFEENTEEKYENITELKKIISTLEKRITELENNQKNSEIPKTKPEIVCFCGNPAVHLRVVSETRNKNRAYCSCKTRSCQFFSWKEGPVAQQFPHSNNIPYNPYN
tara:strand:- start:148 stop:717 length:570 start_codon:yes stop_codon:yes gene_type:complete